MIKSTTTSKIGAVFLAAVLTAGMIALSSPSFMTGAEAYPYNQGNDNNNHKFKYKPSFEKSKSSADYKKCVNINLNFPGLDFSPSFGAEAFGLDSLSRDGGNNGPSHNNGGNHDGFKKFDKDGFICINANDNSVRGGIGDDDDDDDDGEVDECRACFEGLLTEDDFPIDVSDWNQLGNLDSIESFDALCELILNPPFSQSEEQLTNLVAAALTESGNTPSLEQFNRIACTCLAEDLLGIPGEGTCPVDEIPTPAGPPED